MNVSLDLDLVFYGILLVGLALLAQKIAPGFGYATLTTGMVGGAASITCGVLGLRGLRRRVSPVVTLLVVVISLSVQVIQAWLEIQAGTIALKPVAAILTVLWVCGIGQLVHLATKKDGAE